MNAALVISARDNVATALEMLERGRALDLHGTQVLVAETIPRGHKIALRAIRSGEPVVKYGSPIGHASADIASGTHVHTHNVASDRGRGDLSKDCGFRIAECGLEHTESPLAPPATTNPQSNPQSTIRDPK